MEELQKNRTIITQMNKKFSVNIIIYYIICYSNVLFIPIMFFIAGFLVPTRTQLNIIH